MKQANSYRTCWTIDQWVETLREAQDAPYVGYDFETCPDRRRPDTTSALRAEDGAQIAGIAISWCHNLDGSDMKSAYVGIRHDPMFAGGKQPNALNVTRAFSDFIAERPIEKILVVHNLAMELSFQLAENIVWPKRGQLHDTMIAARILNKGVGIKELIGLKPLQSEVLKRDMSSKNDMDRWLKSHGFKPGRDIWHAPVALAGWYAQDDARDCLEIMLKWLGLVQQRPTEWWWHRAPDKTTRKDLYELEIEAAQDAIITCLRGNRIDLDLARKQSAAADALQNVSARWIREYLDMPTLNPNSQTQLRGVLFSERYGFKVSTAHLTDAFKELPEREQARVLGGISDKPLMDFASLDIDALKHYEQENPEHADLLFMMSVHRKCNTAVAWFSKRVLEYGSLPAMDPWWGDGTAASYLNLIFHRLNTVGTISGRMASADFNGQQVPKRVKMLLNAERLFRILKAFLPESQFEELLGMLLTAEAKPGDEAKSVGVDDGAEVVDFSVRRMFIARPGMNLRLHDLSQVEMRGFAHFSGNKMLCDGYGTAMTDSEVDAATRYILELMNGGSPDASTVDLDRHSKLEASPFDIHAFVANQLGIPRKSAKGINFGIVYGMGKKKLARSLGWDVAEGQRYLNDYYSTFPEIQELQGLIKAALRKRGYVFDPFGRRYYLPINRAYVGLNRLIQGWAATAFKVGFVRVCDISESEKFGGGSVNPITGRRSRDGFRVLTCIHDEIMSEVARELDTPTLDWIIRTCMTSFYGLKVPLASSSERSERSWDEAA